MNILIALLFHRDAGGHDAPRACLAASSWNAESRSFDVC